MKIIDYVTNLDALIEKSGIIENWGGIAVHMTDKDRPYGISIKESCKGNIYGQNDTVESEGYMHIDKDESQLVPINKMVNQFEYSIKIELFITTKKLGELNSKAMELANFLWQKKYNLAFKNDGNQSTFTIKHRTVLGCNDVAFSNDVCGC